MAKKEHEALRLIATGHPVLYEVNTRVFLNELSRAAGKAVTLDTVPDRILDEWQESGFDAVWLMGVWTTGEIGLQLARTHEGLQEEYRRALPDFTPEDVLSSPYAVKAYTVASSLGGDAALKKLRKRLADRGIGIILDFVCNHSARDHEWVTSHPEYYIGGTEEQLQKDPASFFRAGAQQRIIAFGRDPSFPSWTDTAQLNHQHAGARKALIATLESIAERCDGVRCDMAMLMLQEVFARTWGSAAQVKEAEQAHGEFWEETVTAVRKRFPHFLFIAEAYWNLEWRLQQLGFDYTYDKILYDRLLREGAGAVREHLKGEMDFQRHSLRFVENHDEPRAARALPSEAWHFAAATVAATVPGMVLFNDGEFEGRTIRIPLQLRRRPEEPLSPRLSAFYRRLVVCIDDPVFRQGDWQLLNVRAAWHDNITWQNFLAFWWQRKSDDFRLVVVNYAPHNGQSYVELPIDRLKASPVEFHDLMGDATYVRERSGIEMKGMYFDLPGYAIHLFRVTAGRRSSR